MPYGGSIGGDPIPNTVLCSDVDGVFNARPISPLYMNRGRRVTVEVNLGSAPVRSGHFDIAPTLTVTPGNQVAISQAAGAYTGKGTLEDESEMDLVVANGFVKTASLLRFFWNSATFVRGNFKFTYQEVM